MDFLFTWEWMGRDLCCSLVCMLGMRVGEGSLFVCSHVCFFFLFFLGVSNLCGFFIGGRAGL